MIYKVKFLDGTTKLFDTLVERDLKGADFRGEDLSGVNFAGSDCTGASFSDANCTGANFYEANCTGASFRDANCTDANFHKANCTRANFHGANCTDASFIEANCTGASFRETNCTWADFKNTILIGTDFDYSSWPLWCGSLHVKADKYLACQILYHALSVIQGCEDEEAQSILQIDQVVKFANQCHRANECGIIKKKEY